MFSRSKPHAHSAFIMGLILSWATLAVYGQVRNHEFITFDDYEYVVQNPLVRSGITLQKMGEVFTAAHASNWHPVTWLSHMTDCHFYGLNPSGHHMSSLALHILCAVLLFSFLSQTTGARWRSFLVAALFALHPLHVESVAWVAERKDVLSGVFWMLTLLAYRRYVQSPRTRTYLLTLFLFLLGLMAKPMIVTLPFVMLLLDYWPFRRLDPYRFKGSILLEKIPFLILSALCSFLTFTVQARWGAVIEQIPVQARFFNAIHSYGVYLFKTFWPHPLAFYYPHPLGTIPFWQNAGSLPLLCLITILAVRFFKRAPYFAVGWFWFLGTLVPVIGVIQVGSHAMADRYTYLPLIGLFIVLSWGTGEVLDRWVRLRTALVVLWGCFVVTLSALTWRQASHWQDSLGVYRHAIAVTSENIVAHNNLGNILARQGALGEAEQHFRTVLELNGRHASAHNNLGIVLVKQGRTEEGIRHYETALRIRPDFQEALLNLRTALSTKPEQKKAIDE